MSYCTDADILARNPGAERLLWSGEADFSRLREVVYEQINLALSRRYPNNTFPDDLLDSSMLKNCEVYGVLSELYAAAQTDGDNQFYLNEQTRYGRLFQQELNQPIPLSTGGYTYRSIRVVRG